MFYRKGYNSWQKGLKGGPFAFAIPEDQGDRRRVAQMLNLLQTHGIEVFAGGRLLQARRRRVCRRDLCGKARPAVSELCRGSSPAPGIPGRHSL